jgi:hypothetical protein
MDSIPETKTVDEAEGGSEPAVEPAEADAKGGPVESPQLPRNQAAKRAAKKVAKKAPAKKAVKGQHSVKAENTNTATDVQVEAETTHPGSETSNSADPWQPPETDPMSVDDDDQVEEAVELVKSELGAEEIEGLDPDHDGQAGTQYQAPPARTAKACGDQPASMAARGFEAAPGCGRELNAENGGKAQIAVLKAKTYLCDDCFAAFTNN